MLCSEAVASMLETGAKPVTRGWETDSRGELRVVVVS